MPPWEGEGCGVGNVTVREEEVSEGRSWEEQVSSSLTKVAKPMYLYQPLWGKVQKEESF